MISKAQRVFPRSVSLLTPVILILTASFSIFAMFFGSGNLVFPLTIGQMTGNSWIAGNIGLLISGIGLPFLGLYCVYRCNGDYHIFFKPLGKIPAAVILIFLLSLIGPFGVVPRCIAVAYGSFTLISPSTPLWIFSLISCLVLAAMLVNMQKLVGIIGGILTPILLIAVLVIIYQGIQNPPHIHTVASVSNDWALKSGFVTGFQTMDLLAAFFFSGLVTHHVKQKLESLHHVSSNNINERFKRYENTLVLLSMILGMGILAGIYSGLVYLGSIFGPVIAGHSKEMAIGIIAQHTLGPAAGAIVCVTVALACLTTAIALLAATMEHLQDHVLKKPIAQWQAIALLTTITFVMSLIGFESIMETLGPILGVLYPGLAAYTAAYMVSLILKKPLPQAIYLSILFGSSLLYMLLT